jgi:RecA/RadA recombinase
MSTLKIKGKADLVDKVMGRLQASRPKDKDCTYDVSRSSETVLSKIRYVLTTGIDPIDNVIGGFPYGRVVEAYGLEGCGKTAIVMRAAARTQQRMIMEHKEDGTWERIPEDTEVAILYIDNEQSIDDDQRLTIDGTKIDAIVGRCDTVDQMFKMIDITLDTIDTEMTPKDKDKPVPLYFVTVIVDTIAGTSSKEEMKAEWGKDDYNRQPKQLRQGFRRMMRKLSRRNVLMICTNQVSDRFDKPKGGYKNSSVPQDQDFTTFGGKALKFFASQRIFMSKLYEYKLNKKSKFAHGMVCQLATPKNRVAKPFRSARFVILFDRGLSNTYSILETLIYLKLAERETGIVTFKFSAGGVEPTTFEIEKGARKVNYSLASLDEWPAFYQAHQADIDALWSRAKVLTFEDGMNAQNLIVDDDDDPDAADVDEDEEDEA